MIKFQIKNFPYFVKKLVPGNLYRFTDKNILLELEYVDYDIKKNFLIAAEPYNSIRYVYGSEYYDPHCDDLVKIPEPINLLFINTCYVTPTPSQPTIEQNYKDIPIFLYGTNFVSLFSISPGIKTFYLLD